MMMLLLSAGAWAQKSYYDQAVDAYKDGNLELAFQYLAQQCQEATCDFQTQWLATRVLYDAGEYQTAAQMADKLLPQMPKSNHEDRCIAYVYIGVGLYEQQEYSSAHKMFCKAIKEDPNSSTAYYERALNYFYQGNYDPAIKDLQKSLTLYPDRIEAYVMTAECYEAKGDTIRMKENFEIAIQKTNGQEPWVWCEYGTSYDNIGQPDRAIDMFFTAYTIAPESGRVGRYYNLLLKRDPQLLKDRMAKKVEEEPWEVRWEALLGDCYETIDSLDQAYVHYRTASLMDAMYDGGISPLMRLVQEYLKVEDFDAAMALINEGLEENPTYLPYLRYKHLIPYFKADVTKALQEAEQLMRIDPDQEMDLMEITAQYLYKLERYDESMARCIELLRKGDPDHEPTLLMANLYSRMGKTAEAESNYRMLIKEAADYYDMETMQPKPVTQETADRLGSLDLPRALMGIGRQDQAQEVVKIMNKKIYDALDSDPEISLKESLLYNLACLNSVVGLLSDAINMLELADRFGHSKPHFTLADPDFENIRNTQDAEVLMRWQNLIDKMTQDNATKAQRIHNAIDGLKLTEKQRIIKK